VTLLPNFSCAARTFGSACFPEPRPLGDPDCGIIRWALSWTGKCRSDLGVVFPLGVLLLPGSM